MTALRIWVATRPRSATAHARIAEALMATGRRDEALPFRERALELDPELFDLYEECAIMYHFFGRPDDAVRMEQRGVEGRERLVRERQLDRLGFRFLHRGFTGGLGHVAELDVLIKQQLLAGRPLEDTILLAPGGNKVSQNPCYFGYWRAYFPRTITDPETVAELSPLASLLRGPWVARRGFDGKLRHYYAVAHEVEGRWEAEARPPLLRLSEQDRERGRACLASLGVPADAWFVGLHVREDRHDRLLASRNADISTYRRAIEAVVARGGWVIRMGDRSMTPLPPIEGVIDYALSSAKSDWMDVFLWAEGRFLIGTESGPSGVPQTFGKRVLQTNWPIAYRYWYSGDIYLPRLYWSEREERYLSFREALLSPVSATLLATELTRHGVRVRDNTPEELEEGVLEMLDQIEGRSTGAEADEALRRRLEQMEATVEFPIPRTRGARIGRGFLRRHAELLDEAECAPARLWLQRP